jgi:hypothetical protein
MGCFGLPPWTYEKEPLHAVKAAKAFTETLQKAGLGKVNLGIATGELLFSKLGNVIRSDTSLLGDVVNTAARLLSVTSHTPGVSIVLDEATADAVKEDAKIRSIGKYKVKGKKEELHLFTVDISVETRKIFSSVGYADEKARLKETYYQWRDSQEPNSFVGIVEGKSGMGKSNFVEVVVQMTSTDFIPCCLTQGSEIDMWTPYFGLHHAMITLLKVFESIMKLTKAASRTSSFISMGGPSRLGSISQIGGIPPLISASLSRKQSYASMQKLNRKPPGGKEVLMTLIEEIGENAIYAPVLGAVLPNEAPEENSVTKKMDPNARKAILKGMIIKMFKLVTGLHRVVFIFDDAQWFDPMSMDVLLSILQVCPKVSIGFSSAFSNYRHKHVFRSRYVFSSSPGR